MDKHTKARRALRKSIKHWLLDIVRPLKNGCHIDPMDMTWTHNNEKVKCGAPHCALCKKYEGCFAEKDTELVFNTIDTEYFRDLVEKTEYICPLYVIQGDVCGAPFTAWAEFNGNPCLESAEHMVKVLVESYNEYV